MPNHKFKYKINSTAMAKTTTPLIPVEKTTSPYVFFSDFAWAQLWTIIDYCKKEVGWYGLVDQDLNGNYVIQELFVPEQEVSGSTTDIEPEAMGQLAAELEAAGKDSSKLRYWGHSHVEMDVRPSGTDEDQIQEYLDHVDWFIRGIHNKKRASKVDVYDVTNGVIHQCVETGRYMPFLKDEETKALLASIDKNVTEKTYGHHYHHTNSRGTVNSSPGKPINAPGNVRHNVNDRRNAEPLNGAQRNQRVIDEYDDDDDWGWGGLRGGNVSQGNFPEGETKDSLAVAEEFMERQVYEFIAEDEDFLRAFVAPYAYMREIIYNARNTDHSS